jgi:diadenosine tetraphosphate (Ap4A) HIT family hydrolase
MSSWVDSARWSSYLSREGCLICNQTSKTRPSTERPIADRTTCLKGHCCLVLKPHVIEIYELSDDDAASFMRDIKLASLALKRTTGAVKLNYEIHGNTIPHMHMHLYPRQVGDRFEHGPIDWRTRTPKTYEDDEFEVFIERMTAAITEIAKR